MVTLINFVFDFTLLNIVDLLLKRRSKLIRLILASLVGEISLITLFISFTNIYSVIFKILLSILMCITAFNYKNVKYTFYNTIYLYLCGIILGGFMTYIYNEFKINREYSIQYIIVLLLALIFLYLYYRGILIFKNNYRNRFKVNIDYGANHYEGLGFLDSGNKLVSPFSGNPIILVEKEYISLHRLKIIPVPYNALNYHGILKCFKPDKLTIEGQIYKNVLIGISEERFNIDGCSVLLNIKLEGLWKYLKK